MAYSQAWLESPESIKGILVEAEVYDVVAATTITIYLSTFGYLTVDGLTSYLPILTSGISTTEALSVDGGLSMTFGDLSISNLNGELDTWLDSTKYIWVNRDIHVYLGDPMWICTNVAQIHADFLKVFDGVIADMDSSNRTTLNIKVRDKLQRLNVPLTDHKIGTYGTWSGTQSNQDTIRPIVFGEVFNISPVLVDPSILQYMMNDGPTELLIEIRDNGIPIHTYGSSTLVPVNTTMGTFTLLHPLVGTPTISIQGVPNSINLTTGALITGTYKNTIANLIALIVTQYGTGQKLTANDLDLPNFSDFDSIRAQGVGFAVVDNANVLVVCQSLVSSLGAQLYMTRLGKLQILQLGVYTSDAIVNISDANIIHHTLEISQRTTVVAATKLGYCKNWTVQSGLTTSIPDIHKEWYATDWCTKTSIDTDIQTKYTLTGDPVQKDTMLLSGVDVAAEALRLNNYFKVPRIVYKFTGTSGLLSLKLGQQVQLTHNRFGLDSGKNGQVISLSPNWLNSTIDVEVII